MDTIPAAVETRLAALETSARRWRALAVGLLLAGAAAGTIAAADAGKPTAVTQTQELRIVDEAGRVVASLGGTDKGTHLRFYDEKANKRLSLGVGNGNPV